MMDINFYKSILDQSPCGYVLSKIILDESGKPFDFIIVEVNSALLDLANLNKADVIGKKITELVPEIKKVKYSWIASFGEIAINGGSREIEKYSSYLNGWFKMKVISPEAGYFAILFIEETLLKKSEIKLKEQNKYLRTLIDLLPSPIFYKDVSDKYIECNKAYEQLLGHSRDEIIGKRLIDINPELYIDMFKQKDEELLKPEITHQTFEIERLDNKGEKQNVIFNRAKILNDNHEPHSIVGVATDITDINELKYKIKDITEDYEMVFNGTQDALFLFEVLDKNRFKVAAVNKAFLNLTGCTEEYFKSRMCTDTADGFHEIELWKKLNECIEGKKKISFDVSLKLPMGEYIWLTSITPVFRSDGRRFVIGASIDVTDYRKVEKEFIKAKNEAEAANKAKSQFLANMSHEIRTPMNGIVGFLSLLESTELNKEQLGYIEYINAASKSLLSIINDILDISRIEAGRVSLDSRRFNIKATIEDIVAFHSIRVAEKNLEIDLIIHPDVPDILSGDDARLNQVLTNLIGNAIKFTSSGYILVEVKVKSMKSSKVELIFSVEDTGIGIAEENMDKLFKEFSQVDSSHTRKYGGSGLGLFISKKIVQLMNGEIWAESSIGKGTKFSFTAVFDNYEKNNQYEADAYEKLKEKNIVIVSDSIIGKKVCEFYLTEAGCNIYKIDNIKTLLAHLTDGNINQQKYDLMLVDIKPNGQELFELLNQVNTAVQFRIPIIVIKQLTSQVTKGNTNLYKDAIGKPIRKNELLESVLNAIILNQNISEANVLEEDINRNENTRNIRILLAEDDALNRTLFTELLSKHNFNLEVVTNGKEAVEACIANEYDLIFMDIQMPVMNGYEAIEKIRAIEKANGKHHYIVAITAYAMQSDREKCIASGADYYISKPVNASRVLELINIVL